MYANTDLIIAVVNKVAFYMPNVVRIDLVMMLDEFGEVFGDKGLEDLVAFIDYGVAQGMTDELITATLYHDIGGRHERFMSPRTSDYSKLLN